VQEVESLTRDYDKVSFKCLTRLVSGTLFSDFVV
jgi:hypothetical protein